MRLLFSRWVRLERAALAGLSVIPRCLRPAGGGRRLRLLLTIRYVWVQCVVSSSRYACLGWGWQFFRCFLVGVVCFKGVAIYLPIGCSLCLLCVLLYC